MEPFIIKVSFSTTVISLIFQSPLLGGDVPVMEPISMLAGRVHTDLCLCLYSIITYLFAVCVVFTKITQILVARNIKSRMMKIRLL